MTSRLVNTSTVAILALIGRDARSAEEVADAVPKALSAESNQIVGGATQLQPQYQLWIGVAFAVVLVAFFMIAYFKSKDMTRAQWQILRFFAALCAGSAGVFIAGGALFNASGRWGATDYAISGAAGFALFFVVWFTWLKFDASAPN